LPICAERTSTMLQTAGQGRCSPSPGWPSGSPRCLAFGSAAYSGRLLHTAASCVCLVVRQLPVTVDLGELELSAGVAACI